MNIMNINKIKVGKRFRKDIGNLTSLKESIKEFGLLHPIVIDKENNLVAGYRRLMAYKELNLKDIPITQIDFENKVGAEFDENTKRKDFTPSESVTIWDSLENYQGKKGLPPNLGRRDKAVKITGMSKGSLDKAKEIVKTGNQSLIDEMDRTGNIDRVFRKNKAIQRQKERKLITPKEIKIDIKCGDFRKLIKKIPDNSISLILTDPPYPKEYLPLWEDLAKEAKRILKPSGFLISYSGQNYLPEIFEMMKKYLNYYWLGSLYHSGSLGQRFEVNMHNRAKPILFFQKLPYKKQLEWMEDVIKSPAPDKDLHEWGQSVEPFMKLMEIFSEPNDVILDPFLGGGAVLEASIKIKRNFIGYEIEEKTYKLVKERLK